MKEQTQNYITIGYYSATMFVGNPNKIRLKSDYNVTYYNVTVGQHTIKVAAYYDNYVEVDISNLLALCLEMPAVRHKFVNVVVKDNFGHTNTLRVEAIFGTLRLGDQYDSIKVADRMSMLTRHVTWFCRFPFTLSIYALEGQKVHDIVRGHSAGDGIQQTTNIFNNGIYDIDVLKQGCNAKSRIVIIDGNDNHSTFSEPFDYPFWQLGSESTSIYLDANTDTEGWYLRWVDRKGFWQQYLFTKGTTSTKSEQSKDMKEVETHASDFTFASTRPITSNTTEAVKCGATHLDKDQYECVSSIVGSVYVELYRGFYFETDPNTGEQKIHYIWEPVKIENVTMSRDDKKVRGDVEIQFTTEYSSQRL